MLKTLLLRLMVVLIVLMMAACAKKEGDDGVAKVDTVAIVSAAQRSSHYEVVAKHLELGGTLYGYVDIDGDVRKLAAGVQDALDKAGERQPQLRPFIGKDLSAMLEDLGFTDIKAVGLSSVPAGDGAFRNRVFFYMPEHRRGLLAGLGGAPAKFQRLEMAPADTDFYSESEIDLPEIYKTVLMVTDRMAGKEASGKLEQALANTKRGAMFSVLELIQDWKGRMVTVARFDDKNTYALPGRQRVKLPAFSVFMAVDGIAPAVRESLDQSPVLIASEQGKYRTYTFKQKLPIEGLHPVLAIQGSTMMFATSPEYLEACASGAGGLAQTAAFREGLAKVGESGNGLSYITPRFFSRLRDIPRLNPGLPADTTELIGSILSALPQPNQPLVAIRSNLADGILIQSQSNASLKKNVMMISVYNPVTVGLMAAMAIPAFQKVRYASQEKAVMNNLRQLAAAADQHYLETGENSVTYDQLVGPDKYIQQMTSVGGEDYRTVVMRMGMPLRVAVPSLRKVVEYSNR